MEHLFSSCTRLFDLIDNQGSNIDEDDWDYFEPLLQELDLDEWISTADLLSAEHAFTYEDLYAMLENTNTVAWLTLHAAVVRKDGRAYDAWLQLDESYSFCFNVDGKEDITAWARSTDHLLEICHIVLRLLAVSIVQSVRLTNYTSRLINAPALACLMEQCQSLKVLSLQSLKMDENHCRVLGAYSRPGLEIVLEKCRITGAAAAVLAEILGRNQGPTKLDHCLIDIFALANGLREHSRLKSLGLRVSSSPEDGNRELLAIAGALRENKGLVDLDLMNNFRMSDESWAAVCDSLKAYPTLEVLDLRTASSVGVATSAPAGLKSRMQALVDMLKGNMTIHTIHVDAHYSEHQLFRGSIVPYLKMSRFRPRVLAVQRTRPFPYRGKVLGRALLAVRSNPNRFWMILSGNTEIAFPSTTATTTRTANLPTPAIAAATSNAVAAVAATIFVTVTATRDFSTISASATASASVATLTAHPERKTHP